mgnify:CR=1 FL=1
MKSHLILGIDPGTVIMGYGLVLVQDQKLTCIGLDAIKFDAKRTPFERLGDIHKAMYDLFEKHNPDSLAMEAPFYGKNVQSMLKLGRAQGVIMSVGLEKNVPVEEYSPRKVKMAITGSGAASKEKVAMMLENIYNLKKINKALDASDGLAVATCHALQLQSPIIRQSPNKLKAIPKSKGQGSWNSFLEKNPDRIK